MKTVRDIPVLENIPVLVRASLNVPIEEGKVRDTFRLRRALPTIEYLQKKHARVVLISHITGESHAHGVGTETLHPMWEAMKQFIPDIRFCPESVGKVARAAIRDLPPGGVLMLENLRRHAGEMKNDPAFALELSALADVFVQDCFDNCHREHASMVGVPQHLPSYAGLLVEEEVRELSKALSPVSPSIAIVAGAKFATKEPVVDRLLELYDRVFIGGAIANDFMKVAGHPVATSLVSEADTISIKKKLANPKLMLPQDYFVAPVGGDRKDARVCGIGEVGEREAILDDGPETIKILTEVIAAAKTVLWNGTLGHYENGFIDGTHGVAEAIAASKAHSVVGGGDTVAAIEKLNLNDQFSFVSTGGGAMLDFLAKGSLPGIRALDRY